jgi:hypothetical protein
MVPRSLRNCRHALQNVNISLVSELWNQRPTILVMSCHVSSDGYTGYSGQFAAGYGESMIVLFRRELPFKLQEYAVPESHSAVSEHLRFISKMNLCNGRIFSPRHSRPVFFLTIPNGRDQSTRSRLRVPTCKRLHHFCREIRSHICDWRMRNGSFLFVPLVPVCS